MSAVATGGLGFSHVVELLVGRGLRVVVVDNLSTGSTANAIAGEIGEAGLFDVVVCLEVIEHMGVDQGRKLLATIRRLMKPSAVAFILHARSTIQARTDENSTSTNTC